MTDQSWAEDRARYEAGVLARLEEERDTEWLRLVASGTNQFLANRQVDAEYGPRITLQRVEVEISTARLRR